MRNRYVSEQGFVVDSHTGQSVSYNELKDQVNKLNYVVQDCLSTILAIRDDIEEDNIDIASFKTICNFSLKDAKDAGVELEYED